MVSLSPPASARSPDNCDSCRNQCMSDAFEQHVLPEHLPPCQSTSWPLLIVIMRVGRMAESAQLNYTSYPVQSQSRAWSDKQHAAMNHKICPIAKRTLRNGSVRQYMALKTYPIIWDVAPTLTDLDGWVDGGKLLNEEIG